MRERGAEHGPFRSRDHVRYISTSRAFSLLFFLPRLRFVSVQIKDIYANRFKEFECNNRNDQWKCGQPRLAKRTFSSSNQAKLHRTSPDLCAKQADLIQYLIVDFACTERVLREIASEEKSVIE
jgi:hypothetical protein